MVAALPKGQGQAAKPGMLAAVKGVGPKANAAKGGTTQAKAGTPFVASKNLQHPGAKVGLGGVPNPQLAAKAGKASKSSVAKGAAHAKTAAAHVGAGGGRSRTPQVGAAVGTRAIGHAGGGAARKK